MLSAVTRALASGGLLSGTLPDSTKVEVLKQVASMSAADFLGFLVRGYSKALLGQSFTTEPGANGNLATAEQAARDTQKIFRYDARCLCDTLEEDVARTWLQLNHPEAPLRILPRHTLNVDEQPTPKDLMAVAAEGSSKIPELRDGINVDHLAENTGLKLVPVEEKRAPQEAKPADPGSPPSDGGDGENKAKPKPNGSSKTNGQPIAEVQKPDQN